MPVGFELVRSLDEVCERRIGKVVQIMQSLRRCDVTRRNLVTDVSRTRVQHQPDFVIRVKADLDKVISSAERSELLHRFLLTILNTTVKIAELGPLLPLVRLVDRITVVVESDRDRTLDLVTKLGHLSIENC